jgi:uncharacterized protein (TIGR04255 family)
MEKQWPKLQKPPIVMVICQVVFDNKETVSLSSNVVASIRKTLPKEFINRHTNIDLNLSAPLPLGESTVKGGANTRISAHVYHTDDQKKKLEIALNRITYTDETPYSGFDELRKSVDLYLSSLNDYLKDTSVKRVSLRFINRFSLDEFSDATKYFKTVISSTEDDVMSYPVAGYSFKWTSQIPENTRAIVNQELSHGVDKYEYLFDIDVLCDNNLLYDKETILSITDKLRIIKNDLFFSNLTPKTIALCNQ